MYNLLNDNAVLTERQALGSNAVSAPFLETGAGGRPTGIISGAGETRGHDQVLTSGVQSSFRMHVAAIIAAGGRGFGSAPIVPGSLGVGGRPILDLSRGALAASQLIDEIAVAVPNDHLAGCVAMGPSQLEPDNGPTHRVGAAKKTTSCCCCDDMRRCRPRKPSAFAN